MTIPVSVLILTKNEQIDIADCLCSVAWSDDIHVFDSFSQDRTVEIATEHSAIVTQRAFDGYASQRNAALHSIKFQHEWVLILDADERVPHDLALEIEAFCCLNPAAVHACRIRRRDFLLSSWLKHSQLSPFYIRLVRPEKVAYEREINEVLRVEGKIQDLHQPFDHFPFSKGFGHWIAKHNEYSRMEADMVIKTRRGQVPFSPLMTFLCKDFNQRRFHQKELFYRLPCRPLIKFVLIYFLRFGFLDGYAGFTYAMLQSLYEYMIVLKTHEFEQLPDSQKLPVSLKV